MRRNATPRNASRSSSICAPSAGGAQSTSSSAERVMIDLYYWPTSNGRKITIMLHEVELPYTIIPVNFKIGEQYAPEFLRINPNNKIPAIVDHDPIGGGDPITVFESVAVLMYLAEKSGRLMPRSAHGRYEVIKWAVFQAASIGP